jgi:hypothetical protein
MDQTKREISADFAPSGIHCRGISPRILRQMKYQTKVIAVQVLISASYGSFTQFGKCAAWVFQIS